MDRSVEKIGELNPVVARLAIQLLNWTRSRGNLRTSILEAYRSRERQLQLFAQGRETPGNIVTYTTRSLHQEGRAFDVVFLDDRLSVTYDVPRTWWSYLGAVGQAYGLRWGGAYGDLGHFER